MYITFYLKSTGEHRALQSLLQHFSDVLAQSKLKHRVLSPISHQTALYKNLRKFKNNTLIRDFRLLDELIRFRCRPLVVLFS